MAIEDDVKKKALDRAKHEEIHKHEDFLDPTKPFYQDLQKFSMYKLAYYQCFKCKSAYFGGLKDCNLALEEAQQPFKPEDLVCGKCSAVSVGAGI
jgi:E3 ubiquitin-protein ligase MYCBP2